MAIYVFRCDTCKEVKEELQRHADPAPMCSNPEHGPMQRQITADWKFTFKNGKGTSGGNTLR